MHHQLAQRKTVRIPEGTEGAQPTRRPVQGGDRSLSSGIRSGMVIAFPTESFYALGVDATDPNAIAQLFKLKKREQGKPIALVAGSIQQAEKFFYVSAHERAVMKKYWPGSLTILLKPKKSIAAKALGGRRIGIRVPAHAGARKLCEEAGVPLTATSANLSGQPPTKSAAVLRRTFPAILSVPGRCGRQTQPSTIVVIDQQKIRVIRQGAVHV